MSKKNTRKRYRLEEVRPAYEEAVGTEGGVVEFDGTDGKVYTFPHPLFMNDDQQEAMDGASSKYEICEALLGEQYEEFVAGGNSLDDLGMLFGMVSREAQEKAQKVRITRR